MALTPTGMPPNLTLNASSGQALKLALGSTYTVNIAKVDGSQVSFFLAGKSLTATTQQTLTEGKPLTVKVTQTQPNLVLQIQPKSAPQDNAARNQALIQSAYRQLLPNQIPISQGIQQLTSLTNSGLLPTTIQAQLSSLLEQLFKPGTQTSARELKRQLLSSGLFLESSLSNAKKPPPGDFKAKLLQLLQLVNQTQANKQPELSRLSSILNQTLNRLTLQQLQAAENPYLMNIQLPLAPNDFLKELSIDIRKQKNASPPFWEAIINLQLHEGELSSKLLIQEDIISIMLWADNTALEKTVTDKLPLLREQFQEASIPLKHLMMSKEKPTNTAHAEKVALIDIHI
ncbi:flagellar hook-length control protein FliK [Hydrogenovibrio sp. 3SP14C1]|uniref:flagellar hook-length control protein FliK n=1 Tax=Hydrogenovibrio sp. 3SP14C1 TaxID=3038774 RepID=UPI002416EAD5|nr:flagellar hook-length control protein FliK [Hydrogenovibrio sp. 3SP14C1]MDG4813110.1 flagellar hook-length control protein FliK [Hydrogenovibrio sp. 3SP14C1]